MKASLTAIRAVPAAVASLALAAASAAAVAGTHSAPERIQIEASKVVTVQGRHSPTGIQQETVLLSHAVGYGDLDLATAEGVNELSSRIHDTATAVCAELGKLYPAAGLIELTDRSTCVKSAVDGAMSKARIAISSAEATR